MNRDYLVDAVKRIATQKGGNFHCSEPSRMAELIKAYPVVWLEPPKFVEMEGRRHGKVTYSIKLHAMREGVKLSAEERNAAYSELEERLVGMMMELSKEQRILCVESLQIACGAAQLTPHGEVAATATARVVSMF